jgi:predicted O-methyltransferase YrrM
MFSIGSDSASHGWIATFAFFDFQRHFFLRMTILSSQATLANAEVLLPRFTDLLGEMKYEDRGIFFSELLFLWATVGELQPRQVVESGRARGLSTAALAKLFPTCRIVSLEFEPDHPDAAFAEQALAAASNIALLYGNANALLPELLLPGDVALIDGPKGMGAVVLALRALATGKPEAVFIHDMYKGQAAREVLDRRVPGVFFSDDPAFVARFRNLDELVWSDKRRSRQDEKYGDSAGRSYGPTLACIPRQTSFNYAALADALSRVSALKRLKRSWKRMTGRHDSA